jgi:hypothetical protein
VPEQPRLQPGLASNAMLAWAGTLRFAIDHSDLVDVNSCMHSKAFHWFAPFFLLALASAAVFQTKQL